MSRKTHDVPLSEPLDDDDDSVVAEFNKALEKEYVCDHGLSWRDDCEACDIEWDAHYGASASSSEADAESIEVIESVIVSECDHGKPLGRPKFNVCEECDKTCSNTVNMSEISTWRKIEDKNHKFDPDLEEWVPISSPTKTTTYTPKCSHYFAEFELEEGLKVYASAERDVPYNDQRPEAKKPDLGLYFYGAWVRDEFYSTPGLEVPWASQSSWPMAYLNWPDYSVPKDEDSVVIAALWALENIRAGKAVETGCLGGHGRTGTMLAALLCVQGVKPGQAIKRVRDMYCEEAIENGSQCDLVAYVYEQVYDKTWKKSKKERKLFNQERAYGKWTSKTTNSPPTVSGPSNNGTTLSQIEKSISDGSWVCEHGKGLWQACDPCDTATYQGKEPNWESFS